MVDPVSDRWCGLLVPVSREAGGADELSHLRHQAHGSGGNSWPAHARRRESARRRSRGTKTGSSGAWRGGQDGDTVGLQDHLPASHFAELGVIELLEVQILGRGNPLDQNKNEAGA
jgi:hypothetical protein